MYGKPGPGPATKLFYHPPFFPPADLQLPGDIGPIALLGCSVMIHLYKYPYRTCVHGPILSSRQGWRPFILRDSRLSPHRHRIAKRA